MMNFVVVFLTGAVLGAKTKQSLIIVGIIGGIMNVIMLWNGFNIYPQLTGWDAWFWNLPIINWFSGAWIFWGVVQSVVDFWGAIYAFFQAGIACAVGWFVGRYWLKKKRWI